ncbi:hypothetical protein, partial [Pseudonocardia sp. N23]|uniref:hypothetical protein n=1 Tax=Pseudonocardia sp. N23 TaxID=1987376 RepID=UPI000BFDDA24
MRSRFVRYESPLVNEHGRHTGIFGLANGLARAGVLSETDQAFWEANNTWFDKSLTYPPAAVYDRATNPLAASWFKASAAEFLAPVPGYLALLARHSVACVERWSDDPGRVVYEDEHQVVVVP